MTALIKQRVALIRAPKAPDFYSREPLLKGAHEHVRRMFSGAGAEVPPAEDLARVARELWAAYQNRDETWWRSLRRLRLSPWAVLGAYHPEAGALGEHAGFVRWYLKCVEDAGKPRAFLAVAHAYLYYFHPKTAEIAAFRDVAIDGLRSSRSPRARAFLDLHETHRLLDSDGYKVIAQAFGACNENGQAFLDRVGLSGSLSDSAFVRFVFRRVMSDLRRDLGRGALSAEELERRLSLALRQAEPGVSFRFGPELLGDLAETLLVPFEERDPDKDVKESIKGFLLSHLGDPRLKPTGWNRVGEAAQRVFRQWLVEGTLEDFFRLLDQQARYYENADRQWRYRSAFWLAYLRDGHITDAWVALGWKIAQDSRSYLSRLAGTYAELKSGDGARNDQAVLVLRVGNLIIAEWSHSSKVRIWSDRGSSGPQFYKQRYQRSDLVTGPDFEQAHHGAERGTWQRKVESYIRKQTGIRFSIRELMPHGRTR